MHPLTLRAPHEIIAFSFLGINDIQLGYLFSERLGIVFPLYIPKLSIVEVGCV